MKIKLQIISDIHLEFRDNVKGYKFLKPKAPILILCGDICPLGTSADFKRYEQFINFFYNKFIYIIHVPGNHEYYIKSAKEKISMKQIDKKMKDYSKSHPKLHYLNNSIFELKIKNKLFYFVGTTMWTKVAKNQLEYIQESMNDYEYIWVDDHKFTGLDMVNTHRKAARFLTNSIELAKKNKAAVIIITHHKPYNSVEINDYSKAYEVDMLKLMYNPVKLWCYGHTHVHDDIKINETRVVSNGLGYPYQRDVGYIPGMCVEVTSN